MTHFYIYQDYVHNNGGLRRVLTSRYGLDNVRDVDSVDILNGVLDKSPDAFIMPGGASRYVADKLDGPGNAAIRAYVEQGGTYIGLCAGAYYACRRTRWRAGMDGEIITNNELAFFPGTGLGPIDSIADTMPDIDVPAGIVSLLDETGDTHPALYWGGPVFVPDSDAAGVRIHARYADVPDQPAAVVSGTLGQGRYLLISPHLEIDARQLGQMRFDVKWNKVEEMKRIGNGDKLNTEYFNEFIDCMWE